MVIINFTIVISITMHVIMPSAYIPHYIVEHVELITGISFLVQGLSGLLLAGIEFFAGPCRSKNRKLWAQGRDAEHRCGCSNHVEPASACSRAALRIAASSSCTGHNVEIVSGKSSHSAKQHRCRSLKGSSEPPTIGARTYR